VVPGVPANVRENTASRTLTSLGIQWDAVSTSALGVSYTVTYTYTDELNVSRSQTAVTNAVTSYVLSPVVVGRSYTFSVVAKNDCGVSSSSPLYALTAGTAPTCPTVITQSVGTDQIRCSWSGSVANGFPISGYQVSIKTHLNVY
jgi:hypothetical protein